MSKIDEIRENIRFKKDSVKLNLVLSNLELFKLILNNYDKLHFKKSSSVANLNNLEGLFDYLHNKDFNSFIKYKKFDFNYEITDYIIDELGFTYEMFLDNLKTNSRHMSDFKDAFLRRGHEVLRYLDQDVTFKNEISFLEYKEFFEHLPNQYFKHPIDVIIGYGKHGFDVTTLFKDTDYLLDILYENRSKIDDNLLNQDCIVKLIMNNVNGYKSNKILALFSKKTADNYPKEFREILTYAFDLANSTGKINSLEDNTSISLNFIRYVYPNLDKKICLELIKFDTYAPFNIAVMIKKGGLDDVKNVINLINKYHLCSNSISPISTVFCNISNYIELFYDIIDSNYKFNDDDIKNLNSVILNNNYFKINTVNDLVNYNNIVLNKTKESLNNKDQNNKINYFLNLFGFKTMNDFDFFMKSYNPKFMEYATILNKLKSMNVDIKDLSLTKQDMVLFKLLEKFKEEILINKSDTIDDILKLIISNNKVMDFNNWKEEFIEKNRRLFNMHMKYSLTDPLSIKGKRYKENNVTVINYEGGSFHFLSHTINCFDENARGFDNMLKNDPSLWTKLDGVSTLSTSSISDRCFDMVARMPNSTPNPNGEVIYLFSEIPDKFLLYMEDKDLLTQHGKRLLNPTAQANNFTTLDSLDFRTNGNYNEVSGYREGMIPTAFLCLSDTPNSATLKAAEYFSKLTGKDVPVIKIDYKDMQLYISNELQRIKNKYDYNNCPLLTYSDMKEMLYRSKENNLNETNLFILKTLLDNLNNNKISEIDFYKMLSELRKELSILVDDPTSYFDVIYKVTMDIKNRNTFVEETNNLERTI